jgi:hypothetical protein
MEISKIKTFPLRMDEHFHESIGKALEKSVLKSKHDYIMKAIAEKIERDTNKAG